MDKNYPAPFTLSIFVARAKSLCGTYAGARTYRRTYTPSGATRDSQGYVTYHSSPRYATASEEQLEEWGQSRTVAVRNAALTEIAERALRVWQEA